MVEFKHIEFMSGQWFADDNAQNMLENETVKFPFVLVNGEVTCNEKR